MSRKTSFLGVRTPTLVMLCFSVILGGLAEQVFTTVAQDSGTPPPSGSTTYTPPPSGSTYTPPPDSSYTPPPSGSTTYTPPASSTYTPPAGSTYSMPSGTYSSMPSGGMYSSGSMQPCGPNVSPTPQNPCMPSGTTSPTTGGTCAQQPNWPDCATFSCTAGNWTCTSMKSGAPGGTSGGMYPSGNMPPCAAGQTPTATTPCMQSGTTGGMYPSGTSSPGDACRQACQSAEAMKATSSTCQGSNPAPWCTMSLATCTAQCTSGGTTSAGTTYPVPSGGTYPCGPNVYPTAQNPCTPGGSTYSSGSMNSTQPCAAGQMPTAANPCFFNAMGNTPPAPGSGTSGMHNCQYPTAQIMRNGQQTTLSVWCEGDYQNCHEGSPSGPAISQENLRGLGAPSTCDSGWNGGTGGWNSGNQNFSSSNNRMCDLYPTGQTPASCMFSTPACLMPQEAPQSVSCDDSRCTSAWHAPRGGPSCWNPGDYPGKTGGYQGGGQTNWNSGGMPYQGGQYPMGNQGPSPYGMPYGNGGFFPGMMMNNGWQGQQNGQQNEEQRKQMEAQQQKMQEEQRSRMVAEMSGRSKQECGHILDPLRSAYGLSSGTRQTIESKLKALADDCLKTAQQIFSSSDADPQTFFSKMQEYQSKVGEIFSETAACGGVESMLKGMEEGATQASGFIAQTEKRDPNLAAQMKALQTQTLDAVKTAQQQFASGQCDAASNTLQNQQMTMEQAMRGWGSKVSFVDNDVMADDFARTMHERGANISAGDLKRYGLNDTKHMDIMSKLMTFGGDDFASLLEDEGDNTANVINSLHAADASSDQTALMAQMMAENKRLKDEIVSLTAKLNAVQSQLVAKLSSLTADPEIARQIQDFVKNDLPTSSLTPQKADDIFTAFKIENGKHLVEQGLVTNTDIDPSDWHAQYVTTANKEGIMKGDPTGLFRPEASMNNAEAAVTLARALGVEVQEGAVPEDPKFAQYPEWARPSVAALEATGLVDLNALGAKAEAPINKAHLADLVANMIPDEAASGEARAFTDIQNVDAQTRAAIEKLSSAGIVSGEGNGSSFNPDGTVNRAIAAKIFTNAVDIARQALGDLQSQ